MSTQERLYSGKFAHFLEVDEAITHDASRSHSFTLLETRNANGGLDLMSPFTSPRASSV